MAKKKPVADNKLLVVRLTPEMSDAVTRAVERQREKRGDKFLTKSDLIREWIGAGVREA